MSQLTPVRGTVAVGIGCALVAWAVAGQQGLLAGGVGTLVVVGFFFSGVIPVSLAEQAGLPVKAGVALLLMTFTLRLLLVLVGLGVAAQSDLVDALSLGVTVIVCALAWSATLVVSAVATGRNT